MSHFWKKLIRDTVIIGIAILFFYGLQIYTDIEIEKGETIVPPRGIFVIADGLKVHYFEKGKGKPVVFIHGINGALEEFAITIFDEISGKYRAIAFDRPGHGYSEPLKNQDVSLEGQVNQIRRAIGQLNLEKPILVGYSYGGTFVLKYGLMYPDEISGIVALAPASYPFETPSEELAYAPDFPVVGKFFVSTFLTPIAQLVSPHYEERIFTPQPIQEYYSQTMQFLSLRPLQLETFLREFRNLQSELEALSPRYPEIKLPLVIVTGDSDQILNPDEHAFRLNKNIPQSKLMVLENQGHQFFVNDAQVVLDAIKAIE